MEKKLVSIVLCIAIMASILTGCGGNTSSGGKKLNITMWYTQGTEYTRNARLSNNIVANWLLDKTGVNIETIYGNDGGQWDTKLSKLISGNNLPDVVVCGGGQGPSHFSKLDSADLIWKIDDEMLEKYAPNVLERVDEKILSKFRDEDGKLLGIPGHLKSTASSQPFISPEKAQQISDRYDEKTSDITTGIVIRDDILKKLYPDAMSWDDICNLIDEKQKYIGDELFDVPLNTTEDYIKLMYNIKDMELSENGKKVYAYGYGATDNWEAIKILGGAMYGYGPIEYTGFWSESNQKMIVPLVEDLTKQAAKTQNKMITDGVIDSESLVQTSQMYNEKALNGQYAILTARYVTNGLQGLNDGLAAAGKSFRYRPLYDSIPNPVGYEAGRQSRDWISAIAFMKTLSEDELIKVLGWINVQFSEEFESVMYWGPEEAGLYKENPDGTRTYTDERFNKYFFEGDKSAITNEELRGLGLSGTVGEFYFPAVQFSSYQPKAYNNDFTYTYYDALLFGSESPHVANLPQFPPCSVWSSEFAGIDECVTFWAEREVWESAFKKAFAAADESDFEEKWEAAKKTLNGIVDTDAMCEKMTVVAKEENEKNKVE